MPEQSPPEIVDVWSRTSPRYRRRAVILLLTNALLFGGLGCLAFWLRTGEHFPLAVEDYWEVWSKYFSPTRPDQVTLNDLLLYPIDVMQVPLQIVILGLLLASFVSIPIVVAILYRFPFSLIFTAMIAFLAVLPWLGITVTISCVLVSLRPLRLGFRFASALLGLIPVVIYIILATREPPGSLTNMMPPADRLLLYAPWVLAIIASCAVIGIVLLIAWVSNYRPGAIAPLLVVMFAIPVVLFHAEVRSDELYYRVLEHEYGPNSKTHFADCDATAMIREIARRVWEADPEGREFEAVLENVKLQMEFGLDPFRADEIADVINAESAETASAFASHQYAAVTECDKFLQGYPNSRYVPNVLYLKGRALDMRVDIEEFKRTCMIRHYDDFPYAGSREAWARLAKEFDDSPLAAVAMYRLAVLEARHVPKQCPQCQYELPGLPETCACPDCGRPLGRTDQAAALLHKIVERFEHPESIEAPAARRGMLARLFAKRAPESALNVAPAAFAHKARELLVLLEKNRDPRYGDAPLIELLRLDPRYPLYAEKLRELRNRFPGSELDDNLELRLILADPSRTRRLRELELWLSRDPAGDAAIRARYELGVLYQADSLIEEARRTFDELIRRAPNSPWAQSARDKLAVLPPSRA